jgi:hypothetical protein
MTEAILERDENEKMRLARETVDFLNEPLRMDHILVEALVNYRLPCQPAVAEHPTVQVDEVTWAAQPCYVVGMLGVINGLIGVRDGVGYIVVMYDDETNRIEGFGVTTEEQRKQLKGMPIAPYDFVKKEPAP